MLIASFKLFQDSATAIQIPEKVPNDNRQATSTEVLTQAVETVHLLEITKDFLSDKF